MTVAGQLEQVRHADIIFPPRIVGAIDSQTFELTLWKWVDNLNFLGGRAEADEHGEGLSREELEELSYRSPEIIMKSWRAPGVEIKFAAPNGEFFTLENIICVIQESERLFRRGDAHHIFFEGIVVSDGGGFETQWGS